MCLRTPSSQWTRCRCPGAGPVDGGHKACRRCPSRASESLVESLRKLKRSTVNGTTQCACGCGVSSRVEAGGDGRCGRGGASRGGSIHSGSALCETKWYGQQRAHYNLARGVESKRPDAREGSAGEPDHVRSEVLNERSDARLPGLPFVGLVELGSREIGEEEGDRVDWDSSAICWLPALMLTHRPARVRCAPPGRTVAPKCGRLACGDLTRAQDMLGLAERDHPVTVNYGEPSDAVGKHHTNVHVTPALEADPLDPLLLGRDVDGEPGRPGGAAQPAAGLISFSTRSARRSYCC